MIADQSQQHCVGSANSLAGPGRVVLRYVSDPVVVLTRFLVEHQQFAGCGGVQAQDHLKQGRLPRTIGTDHRHNASGGHVEGGLRPDQPAAALGADIGERKGDVGVSR